MLKDPVKECNTCLHSRFSIETGWDCDKGVNTNPEYPMCNQWEPDRPHVELNKNKPPLGCSPYYVSTSARICELCEAIKRYSTMSNKHNYIKLWATEIQYLNEMDRMLHRVESEKTWIEDKNGILKEVE